MLTKQPLLIHIALEDEKPFTHEELTLNDFFDIYADELSEEKLPKADVAVQLFDSLGMKAYLNEDDQTIVELRKSHVRQYYRNFYADMVDELKAKNLDATKDIPKFLRNLQDKYAPLVIIAQRRGKKIEFDYLDTWIDNLKGYFMGQTTVYLQVIDVVAYE